MNAEINELKDLIIYLSNGLKYIQEALSMLQEEQRHPVVESALFNLNDTAGKISKVIERQELRLLEFDEIAELQKSMWKRFEGLEKVMGGVQLALLDLRTDIKGLGAILLDLRKAIDFQNNLNQDKQRKRK